MKIRYLVIALVVFSVSSVFIGVSSISLTDIFHLNEFQQQILLHSRLPRLISIIIAGASMAICGLIMQQLSRNKFVSPTTAGTMDSARLGILVSMLAFSAANPLFRVGSAFFFALLGTFLFMKLLDKIKFKDAIFIPLVGIMFGNIIGSITMFFAYKNDMIQTITA